MEPGLEVHRGEQVKVKSCSKGNSILIRKQSQTQWVNNGTGFPGAVESPSLGMLKAYVEKAEQCKETCKLTLY